MFGDIAPIGFVKPPRHQACDSKTKAGAVAQIGTDLAHGAKNNVNRKHTATVTPLRLVRVDSMGWETALASG